MNLKKNIVVIALLLVSITFLANIKKLITNFFETYPKAVTSELVWQNASDEYNAALLKAASKLDILQADIRRYEQQFSYHLEKWDLTLEFMNFLLDWKEFQIEKNIAEIEYSMYSEDYTNNQKAFSYGGVSQNDVQLALIRRDLSLAKLNFYKNLRAQLENYLKETLLVTEIPTMNLPLQTLPVFDEDTLKKIQEASIEMKIAKASNELELTKYRLSSSGIASVYQADYSKRMAKIHELKIKSLEQRLAFELNRYYEDLKLATAQLNAAAAEKTIQLNLLPKVQEAHTKGYITANEYYKNLLDIYTYDRIAYKAEREFIEGLILFLKQSYADVVNDFPLYVGVEGTP